MVRQYPASPIIPKWSETVSSILACEAEGGGAKAWCGKCEHVWPLNLRLIAKKRGPYYSLWNRRLKCRCGYAEARVHARHSGEAFWRVLTTGEDPSWTADLTDRCGWCGGGPHTPPPSAKG